MVSEVWRSGEEEEISQEKHMYEVRCIYVIYAELGVMRVYPCR